MPKSFQHIIEDSYVGWNTKQGNFWYKDKAISLSWTHRDCIITVWKPRMRIGTFDPRIRISKYQIAIIKAFVDAYMSGKSNIASSN